MYNDWRNCRNANPHLEDVDCDFEDISNMSQESLKRCLCKFLTEVNRVDGDNFPVCTMYDIIILCNFGLNRMDYHGNLYLMKSFLMSNLH